jgi:hypothetical protein
VQIEECSNLERDFCTKILVNTCMELLAEFPIFFPPETEGMGEERMLNIENRRGL